MTIEEIVLSEISSVLGHKCFDKRTNIDKLRLSRVKETELTQRLACKFGLEEDYIRSMPYCFFSKPIELLIDFVSEYGSVKNEDLEPLYPPILEELTRELSCFNNWYDVIVYNCIPAHVQSWLRRDHSLLNNVRILFYRNPAVFADKSFILTEEGISYCNADEKTLDQYSWIDINRVEYSPSAGGFYFYLTENSDEYFYLGKKNILKDAQDSNCRFIADILTKVAQSFEDETEAQLDRIFELENQEKYAEAIKYAEEFINNVPDNYEGWLLKSRIQVKMARTMKRPSEDLLKQANSGLDRALDLMEEEDYLNDMLEVIFYWQGVVYSMLGETYNARNAFIIAMSSNDHELKKEIYNLYIDTEEEMHEIWDDYTEIYKYEERKFIMPVKDISGCFVSGIDTFRMENIPKCIHFPIGHPVPNELYIGHPFNPSIYVPYKGSEDAFFLDKVNELCYLLQCLGATEISLTVIKGERISVQNGSTSHLGGDVNVKAFSVSAEMNKKSMNKKDSTSNEQYTMTQKFDPLKLPHVPNELIWLPEQADWQRLVQQRLNGNMLEYHQTISTNETKFVSSSQANEIKGSAQKLWAKVKVSYEKNSDNTFHQSTENIWRIDVKFRSLKEFKSYRN